MERIFHPIGQGAFYSERYYDFNIVYDCGNWKDASQADNVVKSAFTKGETVNILFISHFDNDHVNKIKTLKEHTKIEKVVMPLLHNDEKTLLINLYKYIDEDDEDLVKLIENPENFFEEETIIIKVQAGEDGESPIDDNINPINIDDIILTDSNTPHITIKSGTALNKKFGIIEWCFIPYNYEHTQRKVELIQAFKEIANYSDDDIAKLGKDTNYTLEKIVDDIKLSGTDGGKVFRKIYNKLKGRINLNSMLLYSGTKNRYKNLKVYSSLEHPFPFVPGRTNHVGCIYTGDTDLNKVKIRTVFKSIWSNVGTIQIPHHGDIKSLDTDVLSDGNYICPISVGNNNTYGHPSYETISNIRHHRSKPVFITEELSTIFIEHIPFI